MLESFSKYFKLNAVFKTLIHIEGVMSYNSESNGVKAGLNQILAINEFRKLHIDGCQAFIDLNEFVLCPNFVNRLDFMRCFRNFIL